MIWLFGIQWIWLLIFPLASAETKTSDLNLFLHNAYCTLVNSHFHTEFHLRSRKDYNLSYATAIQKGQIFENHLKPNKDVVVIIHEYLRGCDYPFTLETIKAYHEARPEVQVVNVCWEAGFPKLASKVGIPAAALGYGPSTTLVPCVGDLIAAFLKRIHRESHIPWNKITLIGHSLGCQLSGDVGNKVGGKLWKIIALDPATPFYGDTPLTSSLLHPKSAKNVIVLHTSRNQYSMGTADFYANGPDQPGCEKYLKNVTTTVIYFWWCSHSRSFQYFLETIRKPDAFPARKCASYAKLKKGLCETENSAYFGPDTEVTGTYYFETKSKKPYY